jgi:hypothetical protein
MCVRTGVERISGLKKQKTCCKYSRLRFFWWRRGESNPKKANDNKWLTMIHDDLR